MALYEVGQVIFFEGSNFVVVDPNWLYHNVVGQVLNIDEACHIEVHQKKLIIEKNIIEISKLKDFKKKFNINKKETPTF